MQILKFAAVGSLIAACALVQGTQDYGKSPPAAQQPFPDFGFLPPPGQYTGPVFRLSQDYPADLPPAPEAPFMKTDFRAHWRTWLLQVRDYCFEGNTEADFRVENNAKRKWFHMPWQHFGPSGREGVHGLTREAPFAPLQLAPTQTDANAVAWAVGFYNDLGGYSIGKVWQDHDNPNLAVEEFKNGFPEGTVVFKLLFISLPADDVATQVPYLVDPLQWVAYVAPNFTTNDRQLMAVSLIQMDVMVKDKRSPIGWVFGNFAYNGRLGNANRFENLAPLGVMWGNDPENDVDASNPQPTATMINPAIKETIINPDAKELPPQHLGWNGRMNGPADNPRSSCYSCHMTAEYPSLSPITPFFQASPPAPGSPEWMRWFQNVPCNTPFDKGAQSTDFSLQMSAGIENLHQWKTLKGGVFADEYHGKPTPQKPAGSPKRHPVRR
jgi:hypothetical protein